MNDEIKVQADEINKLVNEFVNKINPEQVWAAVVDYFNIINENEVLKSHFKEFEKYHNSIIANKGVSNILERKNQSTAISKNKEEIESLEKQIKDLELKKGGLIKEIGNDGTKADEPTGLHLTLKTLNSKIEEVNKTINDKSSILTDLKNTISEQEDKKSKLEEEIGNEETEEDTPTGLYLDIQNLKNKIEKLESDYKTKSENLEITFKTKVESLNTEYEDKQQKWQNQQSKERQEHDEIIKQKKKEVSKIEEEIHIVKDLQHLKEEKNKHIKLYYWVSLAIAVALVGIIACAIWGLSNNISYHKDFISGQQNILLNTALTSTSMISHSLSLLLINLPFAIVFAIILAGGYNALRASIHNYESTHKDIRDISAIYAIIGRMNTESTQIISKIKQFTNDELEEGSNVLDLSKEEIRKQLSERLKWNQVSEYLASLGKSDTFKESDNTKPLATNIPNNLPSILHQIAKIIKAIK